MAKLYHFSSGCIGPLHFKAGKDDREWSDENAATLIGAGASRLASVAPPPPTPAPSGRELRHRLAEAVNKEAREELREVLAEGGSADVGIPAADDEAKQPVLDLQQSLVTEPGKPADKAKGPRAGRARE